MEKLIDSALQALAHASGEQISETRWIIPTAEMVKATRHKTGLSQVQFARAYGFNINSLKSWECNRSRPEQANCLILGMIDFSPEKTLDLIRSVEVVQTAQRVNYQREII